MAAMGADDLQISVEGLHYERQKLSVLVLDPLQEIKDFVARNLRSGEVAHIVECLRSAIRSDTLKTVTDGEALIAVLNLYYGRDNLRVLQRLLRKINCYDLLDILNEWNVTSNPVDTRVFRECGYFPLWIRIKNNFTWFSGNKTRIMQTIRRLFRIPEITPGDPDYETLVYMGVSFGKNDLLIYVLAPLCTHKYIRNSLGRNDVCLAFEQLSISGVYFARHSERNGFNDELTASSFTSIDESVQGDHMKQTEDLHKLHLSKSKNGFYNETAEQGNRYFHATQHSRQSNPGEVKKDLRVVRASIGYVDGTPSALNLSPQIKTVEPVRVVRPKILYLDHSKIPAVDIEDAPKKRAGVMDERIVKESVVTIEQNPQSFNNSILQPEKRELYYASELQWNARGENYFSSGEVEDLIVPERKHARRDRWDSSDEFTHSAEENHAEGDMNENYNFDSMKSKPYGRNDVGECRMEEDRGDGKAAGKKIYTSTAMLQVNVGKKSTNYTEGKPVTGEIRKSQVEGSLHMSEPGFNDKEQSLKWNGDSSWYKDAAVEDYYKEMIPEPEPGGTQQFYQREEFYQHKMFPEEEAATPNSFRPQVVNGLPRTPLYSPPEGFRDGTTVGSKLVKVETKFFEAPVQQPLLLLADEEKKMPHYWNNSSDRLQEIPWPTAERDRSSDHYPNAYNQNRFQPVFVHPRPFLMKAESKLESEYEDSVFTDTESNMANSRIASVPPPYLPPPEYNGTASRSPGKLSDDSISTDTFDRTYKSTLLSAVSVSSICKEREMFLSREELQMSIRGLEQKEIEKQIELCKELMIAAKTGDEEDVKRAIEEGVDVDHQNEFGQSAMMVASWEGHLGIVDTLLTADADPNLQEGFGKSALHEAALSGHHTIVHRLISGGAKINLTDEEHRTPLHYGAMRGKRRIVEVLLLFGADVTLLTKFGESAVELAYSYHHDDIVDLLMSSRDKKTRKEMESQIRKHKLRQLSSATSLPNLSKVSSMKELSRSRSRPDLRKKKSVCPIQ